MLNKCPHCGADAREYIEDDCLVIQCCKCAAKILRKLVPPGEWEKAVIKCRNAWNKRVIDKQ